MKRLNLLLTVSMFSFYLAIEGYAQPVVTPTIKRSLSMLPEGKTLHVDNSATLAVPAAAMMEVKNL